jgi:glutamate synthase (NADPH/NADH) small chain
MDNGVETKTQRKPAAKPDPKKHPMPQQPVEVRVRNFNEVALGYDEETAVAEAQRCLQCKKPPCIPGCPVEIDVPAFIKMIAEGEHMAAAFKLKEKNNLPAICGRVCPQETQCEKVCILAKKMDPVGIGRLERWGSDYERLHPEEAAAYKKAHPDSALAEDEEAPRLGGERVAVIGSGPGGLTVAADLARYGAKVTIFEALHTPGGVLVYGIPEFRLPKEIVRLEVEYIKSLGVEIVCDVVVGRTITIPELFDEGYRAVFVGTGAGLPSFMRIPGENLNGVYSANEFLTRSNLMKAYAFPEYHTPIFVGKTTCVLGAGNTAMDGARSAMRLGSEKVYLVYRRSRVEMPAREEEIENAEAEGVIFKFLTTPIRYYGDEKGWLKGMECLRMELGEPDDSGRRRPVAVEGSNFTIDCDTVVIAIGQAPNPIIAQTTPGLEVSKWGTIVVDERTMAASISRVYAGGDVVSGGTTVIEAMGAGKKAARAIARLLAGVPEPAE